MRSRPSMLSLYMLAIAYLAIMLAVFRWSVLAFRAMDLWGFFWLGLLDLLVIHAMLFLLIEKTDLPRWSCEPLAAVVLVLIAGSLGFGCTVLVLMTAFGPFRE